MANLSEVTYIVSGRAPESDSDLSVWSKEKDIHAVTVTKTELGALVATLPYPGRAGKVVHHISNPSLLLL